MIVGALFNLISFIDKGRDRGRGLSVTGEGTIIVKFFSTRLFHGDDWVLLTVGK